jgi:hypothetical protein
MIKNIKLTYFHFLKAAFTRAFAAASGAFYS